MYWACSIRFLVSSCCYRVADDWLDGLSRRSKLARCLLLLVIIGDLARACSWPNSAVQVIIAGCQVGNPAVDVTGSSRPIADVRSRSCRHRPIVIGGVRSPTSPSSRSSANCSSETLLGSLESPFLGNGIGLTEPEFNERRPGATSLQHPGLCSLSNQVAVQRIGAELLCHWNNNLSSLTEKLDHGLVSENVDTFCLVL